MSIMKLGSNNFPFERVGSKSAHLHHLSIAGFPVPPGFVLLNAEIQNDLDQLIQEIGGYPVAVRSSGSYEDLEGSSFAGLYETFLNINNRQELDQSIQKCFSSATSQRVLDYLKQKNIEVSNEKLTSCFCVLVQKMVPAKKAGVLFTFNPLNGNDQEFLLEVVDGLGEALVSGEMTPSQYILNHYTGKSSQTVESGSFLQENHLNLLKDFGLRIQAHFKHPQDIEWAFDGQENLFILQSRPITHFNWDQTCDEFTNADLKDGGVSARVCTQMMYSLYESSFGGSLQTYFESIKLAKTKPQSPWMRYYAGRVYWNAGQAKRLMFNIPGFDEKSFDDDLGIQKDYGQKGPHRSPFNLKTILGAIPVALGLEKEFKNAEKMAQAFPAYFEKLDSEWKEKVSTIHTLNNEQLVSFFGKIINDYYLKVEPSYFRIIYNNANYQSEFKTYLRKINNFLDKPAEILALVSGLNNVSHMEVHYDMISLSKLIKQYGIQSDNTKKGLNQFMLKHYHHADVELDITTPRWAEIPDELLKRIEKYTTDQDKVEQESNLYQNEKERIILALGKKGKKSSIKKFNSMLDRSRNFLSTREHFRSFSTRAYYLVRLVIVELANRFNLGNDLFMLTHQELAAIKNGRIDSQTLQIINYRKMLYQSLTNIPAPNEFGRGIVEKSSSCYFEDSGDSIIFSGIGASSGQYRGRAIVLTKPTEIDLIEPGDILVTKFTDPGWTPMFSKVNAVVTEVGGVLSHAALIGREFGLPVVLNINGITQKVKTGDNLIVDGTNGKVYLLKT